MRTVRSSFFPVGDSDLDDDLKQFVQATSPFALAASVGADDPRTTSVAPRPAQPVEPPAPRPKRSRKVVAFGGKKISSRQSTPIIDPADPVVPLFNGSLTASATQATNLTLDS